MATGTADNVYRERPTTSVVARCTFLFGTESLCTNFAKASPGKSTSVYEGEIRHAIIQKQKSLETGDRLLTGEGARGLSLEMRRQR